MGGVASLQRGAPYRAAGQPQVGPRSSIAGERPAESSCPLASSVIVIDVSLTERALPPRHGEAQLA